MNLLMKYEKIEPVIHNVVNHNIKYQYLHNFAYVHSHSKSHLSHLSLETWKKLLFIYFHII